MRRLSTFLTVVFLILTFSCNKETLEVSGFTSPDNDPYLRNQLSVPLMADQALQLGTIDVTNDVTHLTVNIPIDGVSFPNLVLYETKLYLGTTPPAKDSPGKFPFQHGVNLASDTYSVPLADLGAVAGDVVFIAVHAEVLEWSWDELSQQWVWIFEETAWALDEGLPGWADFQNGSGGYFQYTVI